MHHLKSVLKRILICLENGSNTEGRQHLLSTICQTPVHALFCTLVAYNTIWQVLLSSFDRLESQSLE